MKTYEYPDSFARFYDLIYHQLRDGIDNDFFLNEVRKSKGKILEVGVGTGRFFTEALYDGKDIYGIDISKSMLKVLLNKIEPHQHYRISNQNFLDFSYDFQFDLIVAPFRVIMHILEKENQIIALNNVFRHLKSGGKFIFDTFIPDLNLLIKGQDNQTDFEGEFEKDKFVKRTISTKPDLINQVINITFKLEWNDGNSLRTEVWDLPLRFFFRYELEHLIERSNFMKYRIFGDYYRNELNETSKEFIVECIK